MDSERQDTEFLKQLLGAIPSMLILVESGSNNVAYTNPQAAKNLGFDAGQAGRARISLLDRVHPDDRAAAGEFLSRIQRLEGEESAEAVFRIKQTGGAWLWMKNRGVIFQRYENGTPCRLLILGEDRSLQKRSEEKARADEKELLTMQSELALSEERERRRLADRIHDGLGQLLAVSTIKLSSVLEGMPIPEVELELREIQMLLARAIRFTRTLTRDLSSPVLYQLGLDAALEDLAGETESRYGVPVSIEQGAPGMNLKDDLAMLVFRSIRELIQEAVKHPGANRIFITSWRESGRLRISVEEGIAGSGNEKNALSKQGGLGLLGIRKRLKPFEGTVYTQSRPDHGSRVVLEMPIPDAFKT